MKHLLTVIFSIICFANYAQDLPTIPALGYSFSLGTKFTIKLVPVDSINFNYSIIEFESFKEVVDTHETKSLFSEEGEELTLTCYFCLGTRGETEEERKQNMKVLLIIKNYSGFGLEYLSDILLKKDGEYEPTSNVGVYKGAIAVEMWPYMIHAIGLREFKKRDENRDIVSYNH